MSSERDVMRWRDPRSDADPVLKRVLDTAARGVPSEAHMNALEAAILRRIEATAEGLGAAKSHARRSSVRGLGKRLIGIAVVASVAVWLALQPWPGSQRPSPALPLPRSTQSTHTPNASHADSTSTTASPGNPGLNAEPSIQAAVAQSKPAMRESSPSATITRSTDARPHAARDVRASVVRERAPAKPRAAESATPGHAAQAHMEEEAPAVGDAAKSAAPKQTSVPPELQLLAQAQRALRGAPSDALELTALHARAYPAGEFVEEREAIAVEALVALGNKAAARTRGRAFMSRYPSSAYASRVARLVEAIP